MNSNPIKILFVGESWKGSSARALREGLAGLQGVDLDELSEDHYLPKHGPWLVRGAHRLLRPWHSAEMERQIIGKLRVLRPDVLIVFKGAGVSAELVRQARRMGVYTVNVFPDCSPHAHGSRLREALGEYDLVASTKSFHPAGWGPIYGFDNLCVCVPHGYDPNVHFWPGPPRPVDQTVDVVVVATWRAQYQEVLLGLADRLSHLPLRIALAGNGWAKHSAKFPSNWEISPGITGRACGEFIRRGKIVIAPVHREMVVKGASQPGDEDTTRTYQLAAMGSFFLHRRTPLLRTIYDEECEVPMWDDVDELASLIVKYLPLQEKRHEMAARAHARAVPAYSLPARAELMLGHIQGHLRGAQRTANP